MQLRLKPDAVSSSGPIGSSAGNGFGLSGGADETAAANGQIGFVFANNFFARIEFPVRAPFRVRRFEVYRVLEILRACMRATD